MYYNYFTLDQLVYKCIHFDSSNFNDILKSKSLYSNPNLQHLLFLKPESINWISLHEESTSFSTHITRTVTYAWNEPVQTFSVKKYSNINFKQNEKIQKEKKNPPLPRYKYIKRIFEKFARCDHNVSTLQKVSLK